MGAEERLHPENLVVECGPVVRVLLLRPIFQRKWFSPVGLFPQASAILEGLSKVSLLVR